MATLDTVHRWNGTRYQTILSTAETGGAMSIIYGEADALNGPPTHVHDNEDEIFIVLDGDMTFEVAGKRFSRGPMGTAFVPRGQPQPMEAAGLGVAQGFERRRRRSQHHDRRLDLGARHRQIAGVIDKPLLLLKCAVVLLVDNDQAQPSKWQK